MNNQPKQLYRSRTNRMFAGICGGLGEYFNMDPTIFRLLFVFGVIFGFGSLLIVYLVMLIVIPEAPLESLPAAPVEPPAPEPQVPEPPVEG
jgi:phage shock protein C